MSDTPDNVVFLPCGTTLDIPADRVLQNAIRADLESVLVIGRTKDGELYLASSTGDGPALLWDIEKAKAIILEDD